MLLHDLLAAGAISDLGQYSAAVVAASIPRAGIEVADPGSQGADGHIEIAADPSQRPSVLAVQPPGPASCPGGVAVPGAALAHRTPRGRGLARQGEGRSPLAADVRGRIACAIWTPASPQSASKSSLTKSRSSGSTTT